MDNNARISALEKQFAKLNENVEDIHRRLLEPSPAGEPPLIDRLGKAVRAYEQTSWLGKTGIWVVLTLGSIAAAGTAVFNFLHRMGK